MSTRKYLRIGLSFVGLWLVLLAVDPACRWYNARQEAAAAQREWRRAERICAFIADQFARRLPVTECADTLVNGDVLR